MQILTFIEAEGLIWKSQLPGELWFMKILNLCIYLGCPGKCCKARPVLWRIFKHCVWVRASPYGRNLSQWRRKVRKDNCEGGWCRQGVEKGVHSNVLFNFLPSFLVAFVRKITIFYIHHLYLQFTGIKKMFSVVVTWTLP